MTRRRCEVFELAKPRGVDEQAPARVWQFTLRHLFFSLLGLGLTLTLVRGCYRVAGPAWPHSQLLQLRRGMSEAEVVDIMGKPSHIAQAGVEWEYFQTGNPGWVELWFSDGRLDDVNDESGFNPCRLPDF